MGKALRRGERTVIPLWIKVSYSGYVVVLVPVYWSHYGPANFLWFSDIAFIGTGAVLWLESCFLASMLTCGTLLLEIAWNVDFFFQVVSGRTLLNVASYMFDGNIPGYLRGLSLFHMLLPPLQLWLLSRLGFHPKAWLAQAVLAAVVVPVSRLASSEKLNVNWVFSVAGRDPGLSDPVYVGLVTAVVIVGIILPGHLILRKFFRECRQ